MCDGDIPWGVGIEEVEDDDHPQAPDEDVTIDVPDMGDDE